MSTELLKTLTYQAEQLPPDERLLLAERLIESARYAVTPPPPKHQLKWRDIRGMAAPSLLGEDAQEWVTRTRREGDEHREQALKRAP